MAYLHCHTCYWSQDDFWTKDYNPITWLEKNFKDDLLNSDLEEVITFDSHTKEGKFYNTKMTRREYIAKELEKCAETIRRMEFRTQEEFKAQINKCPGCGENNFDVD